MALTLSDLNAELTLDDNRKLDEIPGGHAAARRAANGLDIEFRAPSRESRREARCRGSFGKAVFVVEELGVIEIGALDVGGGAISDGPDVGG